MPTRLFIVVVAVNTSSLPTLFVLIWDPGGRIGKYANDVFFL
jgi:hypothetical protein